MKFLCWIFLFFLVPACAWGWPRPTGNSSVSCANTGAPYASSTDNLACDSANYHYDSSTHYLYADAFITKASNVPQSDYYPIQTTDTHYTAGVNADGGNDDNDKWGLYKGTVLGSTPVFECLGNTTCTFTAALDSVTATTYLKLPNGASPTVDAAGKIAVDTTADQFQYYGGAKRVLNYSKQSCMTIESLASTDDDYPLASYANATTISGVWCTCKGTCTTKATFTLENEAGTGMTITGTNPTCSAIGTIPSVAAVTANNAVSQYGAVKFSVTNTPTTGDTYQVCVTTTDTAQ